MTYKPLFVFIFCLITSVGATQSLTYYLPESISYNSEIPTPKSIIGHEVGEWHISHDRLVSYMQQLAQASERITLVEHGKTYEQRPLLHLIITSEKNHSNIDIIRERHVQLTDPATSSQLDINNMPAVVYMGYSIHGNEPSGSNASLAVAYYLAAAQGPEIEKLLDETVILLDPSFNPDGLNRFAHWVNSRKSKVLATDPSGMEQHEPWPRGRTNHYWFDLNRDWLPAQLPESQGRIEVFHRWKPNVLTDHHEMGSNSTFFFQPGIPSRNNPLTPDNTYKLTDRMGEYHAAALDAIGSLYYTRESFDDYYYGKGSTYPDINGAVGILFEQASSRGHARQTVNGKLTFPFTIRNQFTTSLSTLKAVHEMRNDFLEHQRSFYKEALAEARSSNEQAIIFGAKDKYRAFKLAELINRHDIDIYHVGKGVTINGKQFGSDEAYIIPTGQPQYRLVKAMFEKRTKFQDSLFYDVSSWTLPLAFNVDYSNLTGRSMNNQFQGKPFNPAEMPVGKVESRSEYAYAFEWHNYLAPKALYALQQMNYKVKVTNKPFYNSTGKKFERGTIVISLGLQNKNSDAIYADMQTLAKHNSIDIYALSTGLDYKGVSLGSPSFGSLKKPKICMPVAGGVRSYEAGEVWHLLDQRFEMPITMISIDVMGKTDLNKYNTMIMVDGNYNNMDNDARENIKRWVQRGGTIVASKGALQFTKTLGMAKFDFMKADKPDSTLTLTYKDISAYRGAKEIGGSIFQTRIDLSHPIFYGYSDELLPVFRNHENFMAKSPNPFANPMVYTSDPLLSGYIADDNLEKLKGTSALGISTFGQGKIIGFTDNMHFRAFWYGTNKAFLNAIFFGPQISRAASR